MENFKWKLKIKIAKYEVNRVKILYFLQIYKSNENIGEY